MVWRVVKPISRIVRDPPKDRTAPDAVVVGMVFMAPKFVHIGKLADACGPRKQQRLRGNIGMPVDATENVPRVSLTRVK